MYSIGYAGARLPLDHYVTRAVDCLALPRLSAAPGEARMRSGWARGQPFDALAGHADGRRGRSRLTHSPASALCGPWRRSLIGLCILIALAALADPGLSDPLWIAGVYDGADGADLAGILEVWVAPGSIGSPAPSDARSVVPRRDRAERPRAAFSAASQIRPPPSR